MPGWPEAIIRSCCDSLNFAERPMIQVLVGPRTDGKILGGEISTCLMESFRACLKKCLKAVGVWLDCWMHVCRVWNLFVRCSTCIFAAARTFLARKGFCVVRICQSRDLNNSFACCNDLFAIQCRTKKSCRQQPTGTSRNNWKKSLVCMCFLMAVFPHVEGF